MHKVSTLILAGALVLAGCGKEESAPADARRGVAQLDAHLSLGEAITVGNLTVWPVFTDQPLDIGEFLTLPEALDRKVAEVREVAGGGGQTMETANDGGQTMEVIEIEEHDEAPAQESGEEPQTEDDSFNGPATNASINLGNAAVVNTLVIENRGDVPILICAGTVVTGGNQDRQIGQDIVVEAKSTVPVDAFCVEQGRWSNERLGERTEGQFTAASSNAMIGVRSKGQYEVAQDAVWEEVAKVKKAALAQAEPTEAPFALISQNSSLAVTLAATDQVTGKEIDAICGKVRAHFASFGAEAPVGFAYALNGKPVNVRSFANADVFERQFAPFLRSMATESLLAETVAHEPATPADVVELVRAIEKASEERRETAALNWNGIRRHGKGFNANCYVPSRGLAGGEQVAVTRDWTAKQ